MHQAPDQDRASTDELVRVFARGGTIGDGLGRTEADYEAVYAAGHAQYRQGRYDEALKAFTWLVLNDHLEPRFLRAHAACLLAQKRFEPALQQYGLLTIHEPDDPRIAWHFAECLIGLHRTDEAGQMLDAVVEMCAGNPRHQRLKTRAAAVRQLLARRAGSAREPGSEPS